MFKEERDESLFEWSMLGDIKKGRPNLGPMVHVAAVAVYISLKAGLLDFVQVKLDNGAVIFALAFASGFTERLLMGAMEKISK